MRDMTCGMLPYKAPVLFYRRARGLLGNTRHGEDPSSGLARHVDVPRRGNGTSNQFARVTSVLFAFSFAHPLGNFRLKA